MLFKGLLIRRPFFMFYAEIFRAVRIGSVKTGKSAVCGLLRSSGNPRFAGCFIRMFRSDVPFRCSVRTVKSRDIPAFICVFVFPPCRFLHPVQSFFMFAFVDFLCPGVIIHRKFYVVFGT